MPPEPSITTNRIELVTELHEVAAEPGAAPPAPETVPVPAEAPPEEPAPVEPPPRPPEPRLAEEIAQRIAAAISSLAEGVELPSRIFAIVKDQLLVEKGALLLYDPLRLVYAPWASSGYDSTTLHRLRIALGANETFNALANGKPLLVSGPDALNTYKPYFSVREFSGIERIVLTPLIAGQKLSAVLLFTGMKSPLESDEQLLSCLEDVARAAAPSIQKAREERLASAAVMPPRPGATPQEELSRLLAPDGGGEKKYLFVALSFEGYAAKIMASHEHLDPFRLHEDLRSFLGAFVADLGAAIQVGQGRFIVGLKDFATRDIDLFAHQLGQFLDTLFLGAPDESAVGRGKRGLPPSAVGKTRSWPEDGTVIEELARFLSP